MALSAQTSRSTVNHILSLRSNSQLLMGKTVSTSCPFVPDFVSDTTRFESVWAHLTIRSEIILFVPVQQVYYISFRCAAYMYAAHVLHICCTSATH